jgi:succinyl-CoA synthetase beta subunit
LNQAKDNFLMKSSTLKFFHLHEYESKVLLKKHGLNVEQCYLAKTMNEATYYASKLNNIAIIKCQVHAGGRSKGRLTSGLQGGVQVCRSEEDVKNMTNKMLGHNLITAQTTKEGLPVNALLISEKIELKKLLYLAIVLDRQSQGPIILASNEGGVDIEDVACKNPEAIIREKINVLQGLSDEKIKNLVGKLNFTEDEGLQAIDQVKRLYKMFIDYDMTQIEINPWAVDTKGKVKYFFLLNVIRIIYYYSYTC